MYLNSVVKRLCVTIGYNLYIGAIKWRLYNTRWVDKRHKVAFFINSFVTPRGLEPPTNRTGICHSIH